MRHFATGLISIVDDNLRPLGSLIERVCALGGGAVGHPQRFGRAVLELDCDFLPFAVNSSDFSFGRPETFVAKPIDLLSEFLLTADGIVHDDGIASDKNLLLVNEYTSKVVYLGPTVAGKTHDKKAADEAQLAYPVNATLDKDTGFQGYEPAGVLTQQPKKSPKARS